MITIKDEAIEDELTIIFQPDGSADITIDSPYACSKGGNSIGQTATMTLQAEDMDRFIAALIAERDAIRSAKG
jgi:hypothetical protein